MAIVKSKFCWNVKCPAGDCINWKQGWQLLDFNQTADLCDHCSAIFEESRFCETFHRDEPGWRSCTTCQKRLHCGCICSAPNLVLLDLGGVECLDCSKQEGSSSKRLMQGTSRESTPLTRRQSLTQLPDEETVTVDRKRKQDVDDKHEETKVSKTTNTGSPQERKRDAVESEQLTLDADVGPSTVLDLAQPQDTTTSQLAPDGTFTLVPLFEKMLTASDAGRIGRLVLPKACAEAFFPPILSSEGIPLKMPDVNGEEWQFQYRFWPNNSSRMYVLEGITPCVKAMHLVAGDVVTFSRQEPGGQLVMGYRRHSAPKLKSSRTVDNGSLTSCSLTKGTSRPKQINEVYRRDDSIFNSRARTTWEEAQELLTPPPGVTPSIMTIDGHRFEEYEEPPILSRKKLAAVYASPLPGYRDSERNRAEK